VNFDSDPQIESLTLQIVQRGLATSAQVEAWMDEWEALPEPRPAFSEFLLSRGRLSTSQMDGLVAPPADPAREGSRFGKYQIEKMIGEGSAGYVFRALDLDLRRPVALKILKPTETMLPQHLQRFLREARIMANLRHPNIVPVFEAGAHDGRYYFAMEHVSGPTLDAALKEQKCSLGELAKIIETVARALNFAHGHGVVHRDLKPSNILLAGPEPMLMDFGLALDAQEATRLTQSGTILGSPVYMAPEQVEGSKRIDGRTDVYALGVILYEGATGRPPYEEQVISRLFSRILDGDPAPPADLPAGLDRIILKAMARDPGRRYATADALAEDLRRFREGEPVIAARVSRWSAKLRKHRKALLASALAAFLPLLLLVLLSPGPPDPDPLENTRRAIESYDRAVLSHADDVRGALAALRGTIPDQDSKLASTLAGRSLMRLGRREEAEAAFASGALSDDDRALNLLLHSDRFPSARWTGRHGLALTDLFAGRKEEAVRRLQEEERRSEGRAQAETRRLLGVILKESKRLESALEMLRADPVLLFLSAEAILDGKPGLAELSVAMRRLDTALEIGTAPPRAHDLYVRAADEWSKIAAASEPFDEARHAEVTRGLSRVPEDRRPAGYYRARGRLEAWRMISLARGGKVDAQAFQAARKEYLRAIELDPRSALQRIALASLFEMWIGVRVLHGEFDRELHAEALDHLRVALEVEPENLRAWILQTALDVKRIQFLFTRNALTEEEFEAARDRTARAPESCRKDADWLASAAALYTTYLNALTNRIQFSEETYRTGVEMCEQALRADARNVMAWVHLGALKFQRANYRTAVGSFSEESFREAARPYEEALKIEPRQPLALSGLGFLLSTYYYHLLRAGSDSDLLFQQAEDRLKAAIEVNPSNLSGRFGLARLYAIRVDHRVKHFKPLKPGELEAAEKACEEIFNLNPGIAPAQELRAAVLFRKCQQLAREGKLDLKDLEAAMRASEDLTRGDRKGPALVRLAGLTELKGDPAEAMNLYDRGIPECSMPPERASALAARGKLRASLGNRKGAIEDLEEAIRLDSGQGAELKPILEKLKDPARGEGSPGDR
jgi:serine/threonine-protein kinase